jgi:glutathione peroxidase
MSGSIWDVGIEGMGLDPEDFRGKVVLIVNTASKCGLTPQLAKLQEMQDRWRFAGFTVLGVPSADFGNQEFDDISDTRDFCSSNYGVTFPLSAISGVKSDPNPLHAYLAATDLPQPRWNFHKFVIGRDGLPVAGFDCEVEPDAEPLMLSISMALSEDYPD